MTSLNIDRQPEAVKRFFESLSLSSEGSVVEMNGKPLARMLPPDLRNDDWNEAKNARRFELIDREIDGTISADESLELEFLQEEVQRHVELVAPLPLDHARQLYRQLLAKSGTTVANGNP